MKSTPLPEEWEKDFDKIYEVYIYPDPRERPIIRSMDILDPDNVKSFIRSLLHQSYEQGERDVLKEVIKLFDKHKDEPMTGNVVNLELKVMLDALIKGGKV